jgi:hypothetical protein
MEADDALLAAAHTGQELNTTRTKSLLVAAAIPYATKRMRTTVHNSMAAGQATGLIDACTAMPSLALVIDH